MGCLKTHFSLLTPLYFWSTCTMLSHLSIWQHTADIAVKLKTTKLNNLIESHSSDLLYKLLAYIINISF